MKKIPLVDLGRQYRSIEPAIQAAIFRVLERGAFILGDEVRQFEREFAEFCGAKHGVGVGSGTSALTLSLLALGIEPGDEVIVPVNTFIATAEAVAVLGAKPVFVDVSPSTFNLDFNSVQENISARTKGIIAVHLYGQPVDIDPFLELARTHGLFVIEDAAQAHGAFYKDRPVGSLADVACFSFFPAKNLGAFGDAGMVVTNRADIAEFVAKYRNHGRTEKYIHEQIGVNTRLDELQAAILRTKLRHLSNWVQARRRIAKLYGSLLNSELISLPPEVSWASAAYHLYVIQCPERDRLRQSLAARGISTGIHYPVPLHLQPAFRAYGQGAGSFPVAERSAGSILSLPMFPELEEDEVGIICAEVNALLAEGVVAE